MSHNSSSSFTQVNFRFSLVFTLSTVTMATVSFVYGE
jgi:hypothetical protein